LEGINENKIHNVIKQYYVKTTIPEEELPHSGQQYRDIVQDHNRGWRFLQRRDAPYLLLLVLPPLFSLLSIVHLSALVQFQLYEQKGEIVK
jgi:hypothetical protein